MTRRELVQAGLFAFSLPIYVRPPRWQGMLVLWMGEKESLIWNSHPIPSGVTVTEALDLPIGLWHFENDVRVVRWAPREDVLAARADECAKFVSRFLVGVDTRIPLRLRGGNDWLACALEERLGRQVVLV
jgi:hypothetical protein